jgi:hypothetical protein
MSEAVELYLAGKDLQEEGELLSAGARETIQDQLREHQARKARVNHRLILWSLVETTRLDSKSLQRDMPEVYSMFLKPSSHAVLQVRR